MLSILIVNWNTGALLRACLNSIHRFPPAESYEIVVVDNLSSDGSSEIVKHEFPNVRLVEAGGNVGYAAGNNLAFSHASGDLLLTLNADTEVSKNGLTHAIAAIRARPDIGCLGVRLQGTNGDTQRSVRGFPSVIGIVGDVTGLGKVFPGSRLDSYRLTNFDYDVEGPAPQPMGTFLLFRREALAAVGNASSPFDPNFPIFFNEVDLLLRLANAGWPCFYTPGVTILHYGGESTKLVRKSMIWESHKSLIRFLQKHRSGWFASLGIGLASIIIYCAAFVRAKGYDPGFRA